MTTLVVDNYDSFTWNLVQLVGALGGDPIVKRNDELTIDDVRALAPARIVLSPGPGDPNDARRIGVCADILRAIDDVPVLGVCLGHQAIASAFGGRVDRAPRPMHGKTSMVAHEGRHLFAGLGETFEAGRYHSLVADRTSLPSSLEVTAWCKDGTVMAVRHLQRPVFGVQFHPESVGTKVGSSLVARFLAPGVSLS
jgi:anthranilate synthase/aminodeoxychorismate synthase-like glutamine amidotransferase